MSTPRKKQPRECLCYDECVKNCRDFQKLRNLNDSGLLIYYHEDQPGNGTDRTGGNTADKKNEMDKLTKIPTDDVFIVHNTRDVEIRPADLVKELDTNNIGCRRCKSIYENAQKLLEKIPIVNKNKVMGMCTHCYLKTQPIGPCKKCTETVKKFIATKGEQFGDNKIRLNTWLSKVNRFLDDVLIEETPKHLREHSEVYINDLQEIPHHKYDKSEVERILKSQTAKEHKSHAHSELYCDNLRETPSQTTYDKSEVEKIIKSQTHLSDTDIADSVSHFWHEMKSDVQPDRHLRGKKEKSVERKCSKCKLGKHSLHYMEDKYDIRDFDEKLAQRKKYCVAKYLYGKTCKHTFSDHHDLDKKSHFSKQTIDESKHKTILKPSKQARKFQSDETMITTISKATKKSSQKDLVYFFPKDIKQTQLQPKSYVSSSTLIMETRDKLKGDGEYTKLKYEDENKNLGKEVVANDKRGLATKSAAQTNKIPNSPASTVTTKSKTDRDNRRGQGENLQKMEKANKMRESDKQKSQSAKNVEVSHTGPQKKQKTQSAKNVEVSHTEPQKLSQKPSKDITKATDEDHSKNDEDFKKLQEMRALQREQELKKKKDQDQKSKGNKDEMRGQAAKDPKQMELDINQIKPVGASGPNALILKSNDVKKDLGPVPTIGSDILRALGLNKNKNDDSYILSNTDVFEIDETGEIIVGEKIYKHKPLMFDETGEPNILPSLFQTFFKEESAVDDVPVKKPQETKATPTRTSVLAKGIIRYALSDRAFIEKGWTKLPTEKVVRRMNVYRMRPAHPERNWFENNRNKQPVHYDTGERLTSFDENGRGRWYYRNGRLALDYYDAEELNAHQRFVVYSNGEPDEHGRKYPITVLATFDYLGNGIVFDHTGKIRLKYNQTEGVMLDRGIGPVSHWKWHALNDPPVLQQVMIDTETPNKDPDILKLGLPTSNKQRTDNEEMLAIEFENFVKEKQKKLAQEYKPFQIKMKALKINENFSLRVLDQATIYLIFRDGLTNFKLNLGMVLDHHEIVDTDTADLGEVTNNVERLPSRTDSLAGLRRTVAYAQRHDRARTERDRQLRIPEQYSVDKLVGGASRPLHSPPLRTVSEKCCCSRKPSTKNVYYDTRII